MRAFSRADHINRARMEDIVSFFYNEAPAQCWGSVETMNGWIVARQHDKRDPTDI